MRLIVARPIALPEDVVFGALTDVAAQGRWVVATRVRCVAPAAHEAEVPGPHPVRAGCELVARTGLGRLGFDDSMVVCEIDPPRRWRVRHTGLVVRGWGEWGVLPRGAGCLVYWAEEFELPWGGAGRAAWAAFGWLVRLGLRASLARLDHGLRSGSLVGAR